MNTKLFASLDLEARNKMSSYHVFNMAANGAFRDIGQETGVWT